LDSLFSALKYVQERLPPTVTSGLSAKLLPTLISSLISEWLSSTIPIELAEMGAFEDALEHSIRFAEDLDNLGWHGAGNLVSWVDQVPRFWLDRRRIGSLDGVRLSLSSSHGNMKRVERIEKENISRKGDVFIKSGGDDDWNSGWASGEDENANDSAETENQNDEDDVSAWGLEEEGDVSEDSDNIERQPHAATEDEGVDDAWGWGDDNDDKTFSDVPTPPADQLSGQSKRPSSPSCEVTLKEQYTVTDIPESVLAIIVGLISDSESLVQTE
jgi:centromere/kinetochore protein ZW10